MAATGQQDERTAAGGNVGGTAAPDEIAKFQAFAETWWDAEGAMAPLHKINPVRIGFIRDQICAHLDRDPLAEAPLAGLDLLDIGCGGGLLCEPMARLGARVTGIDAAERNIRVAEQHAAKSGLDIDYRCVLPEDLARDGATFDVILNMEVVEHVADLAAFMTACTGMVRPGGAMIVTTINRTPKSLLLAKIGAEYVLRWLPPGTHDWRKFVKPSELARHLRAGGMKVSRIDGMNYRLLYDRWVLGGDLAVNYLIFAVKSA